MAIYKSNELKSTLAQYYAFQFIKLTSSIFLFALLFSRLTTEGYASYGIIQSFVMFGGLTLTFNLQASVQKLYSKPRVSATANGMILVFFCCSILFFSLIFIFINYIDGFALIFGTASVPNANYLYFYVLAFSATSFLSSLSNARREHIQYGLLTTGPSLVSLFGVLFTEYLRVDDVLIIFSFAHAITILFFIVSVEGAKIPRVSFRRLPQVSLYTLKYTFLSVPTLGLKYGSDLVARSIILSAHGTAPLATLTFCTSLFNIVRSAEQAFYKGVTPFLLQRNSRLRKLQSDVLNLALAQALAVLVIFSLAPFWLPLLKLVFTDKPAEVFSEVALILMALFTSISLLKNFYLANIKRNRRKLNIYYVAAMTQFSAILLMMLLFQFNFTGFLLLQVIMSLVHLAVSREIARSV